MIKFRSNSMSKLIFHQFKIHVVLVMSYACCTYIILSTFTSLTKEIKLESKHYQDLQPIDVGVKPELILGILSADGKTNLRQTQRETWIAAMNRMEHIIPFRIKYKFLLDKKSPNTTIESMMYKDLLFLNISNHGRAVKFGEKIYKWITYIHNNHPEALLGARIDDDAFLCVPQIFYRLDHLKSENLYYGWKHGKGQFISKAVRIDEMFVVLGRILISRIASRTYCGENKCKKENDLIDIDYGDTSLAEWLSPYNDVNFQHDNEKLLQIGGNLKKRKIYLKPNFCSRHLLFHKSTCEMMKELQNYNEVSNNPSSDIGGVTGSQFSGKIVRNLPEIMPQAGFSLAVFDNFTLCDNWAVVTTIFQPSNAVTYVSQLTNWCLVIVADINTPIKTEYLKQLNGDMSHNRIKYLSIEDQKSLYPLLSHTIPVRHFGRKNLGYIYAIHHKAKVIWDFDDDNIGIFDLKHLAHDKHVSVCKDTDHITTNPYPYFANYEFFSWPRGFPLQSINDNNTFPNVCFTNTNHTLGVIQSLANIQPDVDAIFRLTHKMPFNFPATKDSNSLFVIPRHTYTPFNAQATLWIESTFNYIALPISVNGRVSDIWRSYIAQFFFNKHDIQVAFSEPFVKQERNNHSTMADFNAELDLYQKSFQFIEYLTKANVNSIHEMYEDLYMRKYIEKEDLDFIRIWGKTLSYIKESI